MRDVLIALSLLAGMAMAAERPRAREAGIIVGSLPTGTNNAITDVPGVLVGHATLNLGDNIRTGVTAILPHGGNLFREKVPGAVFVGNGFGKLMGSTQVNELGEIETPVLLTSTLNVPRVADALIDYMLALPGNEQVRSINPVVGETNDGMLNDIRGRHVGRAEVFDAIHSAKGGPVEEGCVGAGTGTIAFGWKGGIGASSRQVSGFMVGVLVQSNFGGELRIPGAPKRDATTGGSIMIVVATNAPIDHRNLRRLAERAMWGMARSGGAGSNGSGDYAIAFSTVRNPARLLSNEDMSPLFAAVMDATEEAIYNSLFKAVTTTGNGLTIKALPLENISRSPLQ